MSEREDLEQRLFKLELALKELERERENIVVRLEQLRASEPKPVPSPPSQGSILGTPASESVPQTPNQKVDLFLKLFRCRESVYPKLWENKAGKKDWQSDDLARDITDHLARFVHDSPVVSGKVVGVFAYLSDVLFRSCSVAEAAKFYCENHLISHPRFFLSKLHS